MRVYAVGDIHGRSDLLDDILERIEADWRSAKATRRTIIFLGDFIDRGPDSRGVIERLANLELSDARLIFLTGNHEEVLLRLLAGDLGQFTDWLKFGGRECLSSYGLDGIELASRSNRIILDQLRQAIPRRHRQFLRSMADTVTVGDYLFVHAGIRPGTALADQKQTDLRWIREDFLTDETDHGFVVVHGHTIVADVEFASNRIAIDTGAYRSDRLSALVLDGTRRMVLQSTGALPVVSAD